MVMWAISDFSEEATICSMLIKVVDDIDDEKDHDFLETLMVAHPLLGWEFQLEE